MSITVSGDGSGRYLRPPPEFIQRQDDSPATPAGDDPPALPNNDIRPKMATIHHLMPQASETVFFVETHH